MFHSNKTHFTKRVNSFLKYSAKVKIIFNQKTTLRQIFFAICLESVSTGTCGIFESLNF